ncbi:DUF4870 domain-containing protein [Leptolyngbya sp. NIES-2104]|uniref:DUF4870 domain-containing protein n=1 Tax=Leptolyngbya sp. NIES-2104 TaxID=1552121 RepID=UPI00073EE0BC|nr:DUF4870 domain-containing protein [Leptolyngbya sp. NIES-2104]
MQSTGQQKLLSALCHGSIFFSATLVSIGIPIVILLITDDWVIKDNAREALNFHINLYVYALLGGLLFITVVGIPIAFIIWGGLAICSWLLPILAIVKVLDRPSQPYRYPFILRLL